MKILDVFLAHKKEEVSLSDLVNSFKIFYPNLQKDAAEKEILKCISDGFLAWTVNEKDICITPRGMQMSNHSTRLSPLQANQLQKNLLQKIRSWNKKAATNNLPGICAALVFGSMAEAPQKESFGDVDVAVMWRKKSLAHPEGILSNEEDHLADDVFSSLPSLSYWDIEDSVDEWLGVEGVNISSIDQLQSLDAFKAYYLLYNDWDYLECSDARQDEQKVIKSIKHLEIINPHDIDDLQYKNARRKLSP